MSISKIRMHFMESEMKWNEIEVLLLLTITNDKNGYSIYNWLIS